MNTFIRLATNECPLYEGDVRLTNPDIPEHLTGETFPVPDGYAKVELTTPPAYDSATQTLGPFEAENINGVWRQKWTVINLTPEQIAFAAEQSAKFNPPKEDSTAVTSESINEEPVITVKQIDANEIPVVDLNVTAEVTTFNP